VTGAETNCTPTYVPGSGQSTYPPGCNGQASATATFTNTPVPGASATPTSTATITGQAQTAATATQTPGAAQPNAQVILGGRGRVVNVTQTGFTVLWWTDTEMTGQINYGGSSSLGAQAYDARGQAFSGATHYVDVTGLQPATNYFFDVVSGGTADTNAGQHYQMKTAPVTSGTPPPNTAQGTVLNPGGVSQAGGALVWGDVKDNNGQGSSGTSMLVGALAGGDGRFQVNLSPRVADQSAYFQYSNSGDQVELTAHAPAGEGSITFDTAQTYNGGTSPQDQRIVLQPPTATPAATATPAPGTTVAPSPTPTVPPPAAAGPPSNPTPPPPPAATPPPAVVFPTATPAPAVQLPVQLPPLRDMLFAQLGVSTPTAVALAQAAPAYPAAPPAVPAQQAAPTQQPPPPAIPTPTLAAQAAQPPGQPVQPPGYSPTTAGAPGVAPAPAAQPPAAPAVGTPFRRPAAPSGIAPVGATPVAPSAPTPTPAGALTSLSTLPAPVSVLFYGGLLLVVLGVGIGVYSLLSGPSWRPR